MTDSIGFGHHQHACTTNNCTTPLAENIREQVQNHPCYSEQAHHYFARMHVAVAPACNIQCHYCNRKYDCANESRPGVVSELLTPDQAVKKVLVVSSEIPQMSVVGIAGPSDPLANPEKTFATFKELAEKAPDLKLCLSTNGLNLPQYVDQIAQYNINHVTITINCVDPVIGAKIYPWIFWQNRRIKGIKAAEILIEQQQKGLEMLLERQILVKVNSVMIPGINDQHLAEVSKIVKAKGAFLHNIMPLLAKPEHGTFYGLTGQRSPTDSELSALQDSCEGEMKMMRHCRQCRADAVGMLGEDRNQDFTLEKIESATVDYQAAMQKRITVQAQITAQMTEKKEQQPHYVQFIPLTSIKRGLTKQKFVHRPILMAVATKGDNLVNEHFGHAKEFLIYEASHTGVRFLRHVKTDLYCHGDDSCGEGETALQRTIHALTGCEVILCARIGYGPWEALVAAGIQPNNDHPYEPIEEAVEKVYKEMIIAGKLDEPLQQQLGA